MVVLTRLGPPEYGIRHTQPATDVFVNNKPLGTGSLFISEARVTWVGDGSGQGFSLEYPHIALHAISKDLSQFPRPCLYLVIDVRLMDSDGTQTPESNTTPSGSDDESEDKSASGMTEIHFAPADNSDGVLSAIFNAMSQCQALHPDPGDISGDEEADFEGEADDASEDVDSNGVYDDHEEEENMEQDPPQA